MPIKRNPLVDILTKRYGRCSCQTYAAIKKFKLTPDNIESQFSVMDKYYASTQKQAEAVSKPIVGKKRFTAAARAALMETYI